MLFILTTLFGGYLLGTLLTSRNNTNVFNDGYEKGYEHGYIEGYDKAVQDGKPEV